LRNRAERNNLRDDIVTALEGVAKQHGLTVRVGGGTYTEYTFAPKVEFSCTTEAGAPAGFAYDAELVGLPRDAWGRSFAMRGEQYTIVGINLRARKYPVLAKSSSGTYKFPADTVARLLAK
jgi:hypothetical protein